MRRIVIAGVLATLPAALHANDWEKFYSPAPAGTISILAAAAPPKMVPLSADSAELIDSMWRKGYSVIGVSIFNSPNASTKDALRFAERIHATYVGIGTQLQSSRTTDIPIITPTTNTSYTNGNISATGSGGFAAETYSGITTTYGSKTTYMPITVDRFDKAAVYFGELAKQGIGLLVRPATPEEILRFESRHLLVVRAVRDGSPADAANILEGDVILTVNGEGATIDTFRAAAVSTQPTTLRLARNGQMRDVAVTPAR